MLNKADAKFEADGERTVGTARATSTIVTDHIGCRELTVDEFITGRIERAQRTIKECQELREQLPAAFLRRPASGIRSILGA